MKKHLLVTTYLVAFSLQAIAADLQTISPLAPNTIILGAPLQVEVGSRYWLSNGGFAYDLGDPYITGQKNSRLTYSNATGQSSEVFWRVDHETGFFAKGFLAEDH